MIETHIEYKLGNKSIFEDIIDDLMLENYSDEPELTDFIKSLPNADKRMAILSLLDSDNNMWLKLKSLIGGENLSKVEQIKDVVLMLREYVKIAEVEKKKFGEVMTPLDLVKEMLATLPKEVWSNPNLKWLDPANGTGPFPIMVIYKLMKGLEEWQPNEELRYKHIIENMIYTCELQPKNMFLYLCAVDPKDEYDCNIYTGSFLDEEFDKHMKDIWNIESFDIIIGNPPYNDGGIIQGKNSSLWTKFIIKSDSILKENNYLCFITPISWIAPTETQKNKLRDIFFNNELVYLNVDCSSFFDVGSTFSYYLIRKNNIVRDTIINNKFEYDISSFPFLPKLITIESLSIVDKVFFNNIDKLKFSSGLRVSEFSIDGQYQVHYTNKIKRSNKLGGNYNKRKVVVSKPGYLSPKYDDGLYNTSDNNYWVEVSGVEEGESIISILESKLFSFLLNNICKYSGYNSLGVLKRIPILPIQKWTDEMLFEYFELTKEEIELINSVK